MTTEEIRTFLVNKKVTNYSDLRYIRKVMHRYLVKNHGNQCSICKCKEWQGKPIMLIVDHIDGNKYNNTLENFRLVCSNCDSQLDTFCNKKSIHQRKRKNIKYGADFIKS